MSGEDGLKLLYLSRADVENLGLSAGDVVEAVEAGLRELGLGRAAMPPKTRVVPDETRYYSAMPAALPGYGLASVKWNAIVSANPSRGLPFVIGLIILNDDTTGAPIAVLDSTWITAQRTAAASAVTARHLLACDLTTLGIFGCGVQGRTHAEMLQAVFPGLRRVRAFDVSVAALDKYRRTVGDKLDLDVIPCAEPRDVLRGAELVVTATPTTVRNEVLEGDWLEPGQLLVSVDFDCYWQASALHRLDRVFTDDVAQFEKSRGYGYYAEFSGLPLDLPAVIAGRASGRETPEQVIAAFNSGVAVEDLAAARCVVEAARAQGVGTLLAL